MRHCEKTSSLSACTTVDIKGANQTNNKSNVNEGLIDSAYDLHRSLSMATSSNSTRKKKTIAVYAGQL